MAHVNTGAAGSHRGLEGTENTEPQRHREDRIEPEKGRRIEYQALSANPLPVLRERVG
jgi:hypothetical protein